MRALRNSRLASLTSAAGERASRELLLADSGSGNALLIAGISNVAAIRLIDLSCIHLNLKAFQGI
jgi:hypothetical protein